MVSLVTMQHRRLLASGLALLMGLSTASCGKDRESYITNGDRYFNANQYLEAIIEYRNAVAKDPRFGPSRLKLGEAYLRANDLIDAAEEYKKAAELMPNDPDVQVKSLRMMLVGGLYDEARNGTEQL